MNSKTHKKINEKIIYKFIFFTLIFLLSISGIVSANCGTAQGGSYKHFPDYSILCSSGYSAENQYRSAGIWYWTCRKGSTTNNCSANVAAMVGVCGSYHGKYNGTLTQGCVTAECTELCYETSSGVGWGGAHGWDTDPTYYWWMCSGYPSSNDTWCWAYKNNPTPACVYSYGGWGTCGTSTHTQTRTATATNSPCSGTPTTSRSCTPACVYSYGGWGTCDTSTHTQARTATETNSPCSGTPITSRSCTPTVNGDCGTANNKTYEYYVTSYGTDTQCAPGTTSSNTGFPDQGGLVLWVCTGTGPGASNRDCAAGRNPVPINGVCGSANLVTYPVDATSYGTDTQCAPGNSTNTAFPAQGKVAGWHCNGINSGAQSPLCAASRTGSSSCGSSAGQSYSSAPSTNLCSSTSTAGIVTTNEATFTWDCTGNIGGTVTSCTANRVRAGVCGSANGKTYTASDTGYGVDTQCAPGTATNTSFPAVGGNANWYCSGINGGETSTLCSANRTASSNKSIISFVLNELSPVVTGTINETNHTVKAKVPTGTDVTNLVPTITVSAGATISPASGVAQNFTNPVEYTVTAEDGSTQKYTITVSSSINPGWTEK